MTYDSGASQLAPWLNPTTTRRPPTKDGNQSSSGSPPDPFSRMTSAVDAEIQQVIAPEEMQLLAIEDGRISEKLPQIQDGRSRSASGQDLPKSRPSSKIGLKSRASTKLPRIYTSVHIDEEDEEAEKPPDDSDEEPEGSDTLAPWMTPAGVKKERRSARSRSPRSQMSGHNETGEIDIEQDVVVSRARSSKVRSDSRPVSKSSLRDTEGQKSITPGVQAEKKETAESDRMTQSGRKKSKSRSELQATDEQNLSEASTDNLSKLRATPQLEQSDEASYSESKEETLNQGNLESVQTKTDIDKERSRTLDPEEKLKRSRTHKERSRSPRKRSALDKEHSRLAQRSKTSFEKPKTPEVRPRSFMSERDESEDDVHKDSGIEQSEVSDAQSEKIVLRERTRTVLSRSSRKRSSSSAKLNQESKSLTVDTSQGDLETSEDPSLTMQSNSDSKSPTLQSKSLSKSSVRRSDADGTVSLDDGIPSENVSTTEKSKSDDAKINDGTVSRSKTKSASQKASLLDNEQLSRMTDESEHIELDSALSVVDNAFEEDDEFEEELNLPGMSAIGAESVTDDMKTSRSSRVRSTQDADAGIRFCE